MVVGCSDGVLGVYGWIWRSFNNGSQMVGIMCWEMNDSRSSLVLVLVGAKMEGYE